MTLLGVIGSTRERWVTLLGVIGSTRVVTKQKNLFKNDSSDVPNNLVDYTSR